MGDFDLSGYLGVFLDEVDEQLQILDSEVLMLEKDPTNQQTIQTIFRAAHTLKGSSAAMGFEKMKELTHHLENVFENIRQEKIYVTKELVEVIFDSIDGIRQLKDEIVQGSTNLVDIQPMIEQLQLRNEQEQLHVANKSFEIIAHNRLPMDAYQKLIVDQGIETGLHAYDIQLTIAEDCLMKAVRALVTHNSLAEQGDFISFEPAVQTIENNTNFDGVMQFVFITAHAKQQLSERLNKLTEISHYSVHEIVQDEKVAQEQSMTVDKATVEQLRMATTETNTSKVKVPATVRVDVDKLEYLMNLVGELVIDQTRLVDVRGRFAQKNIHSDIEYEMLDDVTNHLNRVVSELQEGMMKTRMMPIEQLFNRFPRMVRDTANKANKEINFIVHGKETDLDRTLIEEIGDPIIHLLRNAIDHGIECAEDRFRNGKPKEGQVLLKAAHEENHVVITIQDDGKGIDPNKIKQASIEKGFITVEQAQKLSDKDALFLIFDSGVSTAKEITELSGRGVGMDIVKSHIEKLNGTIDIESAIGAGTTFTIKLPLTLAIIRSLLVKFADRTFAIPLANVIEIVRLDKEDIQDIQDKEVGMIRGRILPLIRMNEVLKISNNHQDQPNKKREFVIVVGIADKRIGLIADRMIGNQEIVIKSLGSYMGTPKYISGATIMGDGSVALILDISAVIKNQGSQTIESDNIETKELDLDENQLITFKCAEEEYGVGIECVKDIIAVSTITKVANAPDQLLGILNLRGKMLSVFDLRSQLGLPKGIQTKKTRIIVIEYLNQEFGLLVDEVTQVLKTTDLKIEEVKVSKQLNNKNIIQGVTQLQERIVFILAIEKLLASVELEHL